MKRFYLIKILDIVFVRYILIAIVAYLVDFGGYVYLIYCEYNPELSNIIVKVFAAIFGFIFHRFYTYSIKDSKKIIQHASKYFGLAFFYTPLSTFLLHFILIFLENPFIAKCLSDVLLFFIMFNLTTKFSFK